MARVDALSIELQSQVGKDKLSEEYGKTIDTVQANTVSSKLKNKNLSGDPTSGSVEAKRWTNVSGNAYGTARAAGKGQNIKVDPVVIQINDDTEYISEVEEKDIRMYGVAGLITKEMAEHEKGLEAELETKFFAEAVNGGASFTPTGTPTIEDEIEEAIQTIETTKNNYVRGVPRTMINVVMTPQYYGKLRNKINSISNSNGLGQVKGYEEGIFNNVSVFSNVFLPNGINYIVMVDGAVAQPVRTSESSPAKIPLSDATSFGLFAYKGTKTVMGDLIIYNGAVASL